MNFSKEQKWMLFASLLSILLIFIFSLPNKKVIHLQNSFSCKNISFDSLLLFQKKVIPNRIPKLICYLRSKNIRVGNDYELLLLLSNPITRQRLANDFHLDSTFLLLHAELAGLMQIGMSNIDAQILHFSQRNYQNPFSGTTINLHILSEADAESILEDIGGWAAGNENPLVKNYQLSLEEVKIWIERAEKISCKYITFFDEKLNF